MIFMGLSPLGALLAGTVAASIGAAETVALGGSAGIVGAVFFGYKRRHLTEEGRQMIVSMQMTGGEPASKAALGQPPSS
jgi:hypothetical protein